MWVLVGWWAPRSGHRHYPQPLLHRPGRETEAAVRVVPEEPEHRYASVVVEAVAEWTLPGRLAVEVAAVAELMLASAAGRLMTGGESDLARRLGTRYM